MNILTVGSTGRVGSETALTLAKQGASVSALARGGRNHPRAGQLAEGGVQIVEGDLCDPGSLNRAVRGIEAVFCSATSMPSPGSDGLQKVDHDGTLALIEAADRHGVSKFIFVSYSGNLRYDSPLETAKRDCEDRLLRSRMQAIILRPSFFMEVWLSPMLGFDPLNGSARIYGAGDGKGNYISSSNVADFAVKLATWPIGEKNTILELGGPEALSQIDVVHLFEQRLGHPIKLEYVPVDALASQHQSSDPVQKSFSALMLAYAAGDVIEDAVTNARKYRVELRTVSEYADHVCFDALHAAV